MPSFSSPARSLPLVLTVALACGTASAAPVPSFGPDRAADDMSLVDPPNSGPGGQGVFFWTPPDVHYFTSTMERVPDADDPRGTGYVKFVVDHPAKIYHPVGVGFGSRTDRSPWTIDMSGPGADSVSIEIENVSKQALRVRITLKDADENMIDTREGTPLESPWDDPYEFALAAGAVVTRTFGYKGGYYAQYDASKISRCDLFADPAAPSTPCGESKLDFSKVAGANITINSRSPETLGVDHAEVRIRRIAFGVGARTTGVAPRSSSQAPGSLRGRFLDGVVGYPRDGRPDADLNGRSLR